MSTNPPAQPRRDPSPVHYDFLPKEKQSGTPDSPTSYVKSPAGHPPTAAVLKADSVATDSDGHDTESTATNSSDEFNWEEEDEGENQRILAEKKARRGRRIWLMYTRLAAPLRAALLAVIFGGIFVTPGILFLLVFPNNPARPQVVPWSFWVGISWGVSCALSLIVDGFPRVLLWIIFVVYGKAPETFKTQLELFMAVSFWMKLALDISATWITLGIVRHILNPPGRYWEVVNRVVSAVFAAGIIFLVEKAFVRIIAIRFHQKALADRLHENRIALKALDKLSSAVPQHPTKKAKKSRSPGGTMIFGASGSNNASPFTSRPATPELKAAGAVGKKEYAVGEDNGTAVAQDGSGKTKIRRGKKNKAVTDVLVDQLVDLKDAIGQVALKDSKFNRQGEIGSLYSARRLARQLFGTLSSVYPPRSHLIVEDFYPYFRSEADAKVAFSHFDKDGNGDISKREMREAVQRIYRERKALSASLKDMSSAVSKLDAVMTGVALIIILFAFLLILNPSDDISSLIPVATIVLGFSFIFGNSAKTIFESLIFIFSTHVYDVGDLVIIDDQILFVKEFGLFATTFRRVDGQEVVAPNSLLGTVKLIHNVRRSGSMWETTTLGISYNTPMEIIEQLKVRLRKYMSDNSREWGTPGLEIWIDSMKFQNCINLTIALEHRHNWQDWGGRWGRRNLFMKYMRTVLEELEIAYSLPPQPVTFSGAPPSWAHQQPQFASPTLQVPPLGRGGSGNPIHGNAGTLPRDPMRSSGFQMNLDHF